MLKIVDNYELFTVYRSFFKAKLWKSAFWSIFFLIFLFKFDVREYIILSNEE